MHIRMKKTLWYLALTFGLSYGLFGIVFALVPGEMHKKILMPLSLVYMFMPMVAVLLVQKVVFREPFKISLGISFRFNRWFVVAALLPPVIALLTLGCSLFLPGVTFSWEMEGVFARFANQITPEQFSVMQAQAQAWPIHPFWLALFSGILAGATINAVAGFGEELGWRGLLQKELNFLGFWRSSLMIGLIWGIWHAPIIWQGHNYPSHPREGVFYMIYFTVLLSPLFAYIRVKSKSVIACAIMHGTLNGTAGISFMLIKGGNDLSTGITGIAGFIVLAMANAGLLVYDRFFSKEPVISTFKNTAV
ncbi:CPBP family intramembrane metalloprotease [bacterium]|nr:CPBP family intramembrane metalloprotease [bacterium]